MHIKLTKERPRMLVVRLTRYYGFSVRRLPDADGTRWLVAVVWYYKAPQRLGYWYPSLRWL